MALRNILRDTDKTLLKKSRVITDFNKRLHVLLDDMRETLAQANGLGLAAPQVGVLRRAVLVVDINDIDQDSQTLEEKVVELINPRILARSGTQSGSEGCLSLPGVYGLVTRPDLVKVAAQDRYGKPFEIWGKGLTARALCHEIDHLDGIIFTTLAERLLTEEEVDAMNAADDEEYEEDSGEGGDLIRE
ncbi:MAG: peptide deformylase [Oscillospiraceae bacterium]|nr:peptide deformylase [Oscillospiraceae bacterium]